MLSRSFISSLAILLSVLYCPGQSSYDWETLINQRLGPYDLKPDNYFRLAAYSEMKGEYSSQHNSLTLHFGDLGSLSFYERNCLFRNSNGVWHLDANHPIPAQSDAMNAEISHVFDQIILLGNHNSKSELVEFVDKHLSRKNIEPFDKIFLRHILIKHGRYEPEFRRVVFHTDWLPDTAYTYRAPGEERTVRKPTRPLMIKLDENFVRGYYIWSGGTVYVEDVTRNVRYATGEEYMYNVAAFKVFVQKLFVQTTHYIVQQEQERLDNLATEFAIRDVIQTDPRQEAYAAAAPPAPTYRSQGYGRTRGADQPPKDMPTIPMVTLKGIEPLYHPYSWIPMMLHLLRKQGVNVGDADVIKYFVGQPYFKRLYDQLNEEERRKVDHFLNNQ